MLTILPQPVGGGPGWRVHDYKQLSILAEWEEAALWFPDPPPTGSRPRATLPQIPNDELWLVNRLVVQTDAEVPTFVRVYLDLVEPTRIVDGADDGNFTVTDMSSPLQVPGSSSLICRWDGDPDQIDFHRGNFTASMHLHIVVLRRG